MALSSLIPQLLKKIPMPVDNGHPQPGSRCLEAVNPPFDNSIRWVSDDRISFEGPGEGADEFSSAYRIGRSWASPGVVRRGTIQLNKNNRWEEITGVLPWGQIGTRNYNMPASIATFLQEIRKGNINPGNPCHLAYHQDMAANVVNLFMPLAIGKIVKDIYGADSIDESAVDVVFRHRISGRKTMPVPYDSVMEKYTFPGFESSLCTKVSTVCGVQSEARVLETLADYTPELIITSPFNAPGLKLTIVDIQRAGAISAILTKIIAEQYGIDASIISADVKRTNEVEGDHFSPVAGAVVARPTGYLESGYSRLKNEVVFPADYEQGKKNIVIIPDPMLASGVSTIEIVGHLRSMLGCKNGDIYVVPLFTGGYSSIRKLQSIGVNIITLAHDQANLSGNGYIIPGLGDFGDRTWQEKNDRGGGLITAETLSLLYSNLAATRTDKSVLNAAINAYSLQLCGIGIN